MKSMDNKNTKVPMYVGIAIAVLIAIGLYWYLNNSTKKVETTEEAVEVLSEATPATIETNPVKKVPDLNPVEKTNPFKTTNPFE